MDMSMLVKEGAKIQLDETIEGLKNTIDSYNNGNISCRMRTVQHSFVTG